MKMKKIALLLGGPSAEKKVSLVTGKHVYKSLQELGYLVKKIHVSSNKKIFIEKLKKFNPDFIFNALHGTFGEDGQVQRILDKLKIKYSHSGAKASEIAIEKAKEYGFKTISLDSENIIHYIIRTILFNIKPTLYFNRPLGDQGERLKEPIICKTAFMIY